MKTTLTLSLMVVGALLVLLVLMSPPTAIAENPETVPPVILALESGQADMLFAQVDQGGGNPDLVAFYNELKQLAKDYKNATRDRKKQQGIFDRAEELMGRLFDAKVQDYQNLISALELRLKDERARLKSMQLHKQDLLHTGVRKALDEGQLPEWAAPAK